MNGGVANTREISLGDDFSDVVVRVNGVRVEFHENGSVDLYTDRPVVVHAAVNGNCERSSGTPPQVGDKMADGTVYAGVSPDTGKPLYAAAADAPLTMEWKQAMDYAAALDAHGHKDWRAPTKSELNVLFQNRAAIGGFDISGSDPAGWYWSSSQDYDDYAWAQRFRDGNRFNYGKFFDSSLRCVR